MGASNAALIVHDDGSFEATPELRKELHLAPGTRLEFVQRSGEEIRFRVPRAFPEIHSWRDLQGILANTEYDPNADLERDRIRELELDAR
jgi:hypothetical protein